MRNEFEIRGDKVAVFLNRRDGSTLETIIDLADLDRAQEFEGSWYGHWNPDTKSFYAVGCPTVNSKRTTILLHRYLMDTPKGIVVDHKHHDTLDNTRENMRNTTPTINSQNRVGLDKDNTSGHRGVSWHKTGHKWQVCLRINGKLIYLGLFTDIQLAARAAHEARVKLMPGYVC